MSYLLSLDLGVQSVGWGIIQNGKIYRLGVRCFDSGTGSADDISKGKDESRNTARRMARAVRRQFQRRSQRAAGIAAVLQNAGLLPLRDQYENPYNVRHPEERDKLFKELDWTLTADLISDGDRVNGHLLPYLLRAYALKKTLPNFALGRALFHLGQRRGYLSNRKTVDLDEQDDEQGKVLGGIAELTEQMQNAGCTTLGEYFSKLDPEQQRIRQRYTSRQMFIDEFKAIWKAQATQNPLLTDDLYNQLYRAIFFQRPLKSMRNKLGKCELVPDKRRAPIACMEFQRFRYWQKILDFAYQAPGDDWQYLSAEQTQRLATAFEENESLTFTDIKELFGWKRTVKINLAEGGAKKIKGNVTAARLRKAIPLRWQSMDDAQKDALVAEILQFEHEDALARRLIKVFEFSTTEAETVAHTYLENGWASLSKAAIKQLLPYMIDNQEPFATAVKSLFNVQKQQDTVYDRLPPLTKIVGSIRNPIVERALSETRKVVNAVIRYAKANGLSPDGKPDQIVIELARDIKKSRKQRENDFKLNRENETKREAARNKIIQEAGIAEPKGGDILKVILAEECSWNVHTQEKRLQ